MVVGAEGLPALPWLEAPLRKALETQRGHALLVHGAQGSGTLHFASSLARAWLCESDAAPRPCGTCTSCRLIDSRVHPDLMVLLPELLRRELGWPLASDRPDTEEGKRKPSRQIRIDEVRLLIDWSTRTSGRGRAKVAVLHPAEALNAQSANALLKTLEEPAPGTRLLLTCADPASLLPTVRSRCQLVRLADPDTEVAAAWLAGQGVERPLVLLAACAGRPLDALALTHGGVDAEAWAALPTLVAGGRAEALAGWPVARVLDALNKLCHDALAMDCGGGPRYFPVDRMPRAASTAALLAWSAELGRLARHAEHPWHEGLLVDALVHSGARALARSPGPAVGGGSAFDTLAG